MKQKRRILVVDDEPQIGRVLRMSLAMYGNDVRVAADGESALDTFKDWSPDLVSVTSGGWFGLQGSMSCTPVETRPTRLTATEPPLLVMFNCDCTSSGSTSFAESPLGLPGQSMTTGITGLNFTRNVAV